MNSPSFHRLNDSQRLAYHRVAGRNPGIVFLCGHGSDMDGSKALFLEDWAKRHGHAFLRFDYTGHGQSDGDFLKTNISDWTRDTVAAIDALTEGTQILIGSSLGGWLMLNAALMRHDRVAGLIGIAAAPDFTEDLIWQPLEPAARAAFVEHGQIAQDNPYSDEPVIYPYHLIEDGRQHLRLRHPIDLTQPVRLLHGMKDAEVPWHTAVRLAETLQSDDVKLHIDKTATHRFSEPNQLALLATVLADLISQLEA